MRFSGIVLKGNGSGRALGFPTANIAAADDSLSGIYAAYVRAGYERYEAVVYADTRRKLLEAHLFHFKGDLYDKEIAIELLEKLRDDRAFADEDDARRAIAADVTAAHKYFNRLALQEDKRMRQ